MPLEPGLTGEVEHLVTEQDTALARGSGDVRVLATPTVIRLCEQAAVRAVAAELEEGATSVSVRWSLDHLAPTVPGKRVVARAILEGVEGRRLEFSIEASDDAGVIATGLHARVMVDHESFLKSAAER